MDPATPFRIQCRRSQEGAALEGLALPLPPAVSADKLRGNRRIEGADTKGLILGQTWYRLRMKVPCESPEPQRQRVRHRQPRQTSPPPSLARWASSALTCPLGNRQLSRRGLCLPLLSGIVSTLRRSERKRDGVLFLFPLPPRTSAPVGRGATAAVTASH